jgi:hypothetical protein
VVTLASLCATVREVVRTGAGVLVVAAMILGRRRWVARRASPGACGCKHARDAVMVRLSRRRWPNVADHVADVDQPYARVLHLDRRGVDENRAGSRIHVPARAAHTRYLDHAVRGRRRYPDGFLDDLRKHRDEAQRASAAFIEQAREQVGPQ